MGELITVAVPVLQRGIHYMTSPYGMRTLNGQTKMHNGVDLVSYLDGATTIDYIVAYADGIVTANGFDGARGYYLMIDHGTFRTIYQHMRYASILMVGQPVQKGWVVGLMGNTGNSTGAHLHFGVEVDGKWVDPMPYLEAAPSESWAWAVQSGLVAPESDPTTPATLGDVAEMLYKQKGD